MKRFLVTVLLSLSCLPAFAQGVRDVLGDGRSTVFPQLGSIIQVSGPVARSLMLALDVEREMRGDELGTIIKKGENLKCTFLSRNTPDSGLITYTCEIHFDTKGTARKAF
jgi:hypothetical protein